MLLFFNTLNKIEMHLKSSVCKKVVFCGGVSHYIDKNLLKMYDEYNLVSFIYLCDNLKVIYVVNHCLICCPASNKVIFIGKRIQNIYMVVFDNPSFQYIACLFINKKGRIMALAY